MMLKKIKYVVKFSRRNSKNRHDIAPVEIRLSQVGTTKYKNLKIFITPSYWDEKNKVIKNTHPNEVEYNKRISEALLKMRAYENKQINLNGFCHVDKVLSEYNKSSIKATPTSFIEFFKEELSLAIIKPSTLKTQTGTFNKLCQYKKNISFEQLDFEFIERFQSFMYKKNLKNKSINTQIGILRTYVNKAIRKGYIDKNLSPFLNYKPLPEEDPERVFFNDAELERWENLTFSKEEQHLEKVRDCFLLLCYTGLRHSDLKVLNVDDNIETCKDGLVFSILTEKCKTKVRLPVHSLFLVENQEKSKAETLTNKLIDNHLEKHKRTKNANSVPFASLSLGYFNRALKKLARRAGIKKNVSSHAGRRTFATSLYNMGIGTEIIQRLLGHKKIDMTMLYILLNDKSVIDKLKRTRR